MQGSGGGGAGRRRAVTRQHHKLLDRTAPDASYLSLKSTYRSWRLRTSRFSSSSSAFDEKQLANRSQGALSGCSWCWSQLRSKEAWHDDSWRSPTELINHRFERRCISCLLGPSSPAMEASGIPRLTLSLLFAAQHRSELTCSLL